MVPIYQLSAFPNFCFSLVSRSSPAIGRWGQTMLFFDYLPMAAIATANIFDMR